LQRSPDPLAGFKGPSSNGEVKEKRIGVGRGEQGKKGKVGK